MQFEVSKLSDTNAIKSHKKALNAYLSKTKRKKSGFLSLKVVKMKRKREREGESKFERDVSNERCYKNLFKKSIYAYLTLYSKILTDI